MKLLLFVICIVLSPQSIIAQQYSVPLTGVSTKTVEVNVNGDDYSFLLDTGASFVTFPEDDILLMYAHSNISPADFDGTVDLTLADGSIIKCSHFVIKDLTIGGCHIKNVDAVVIPRKGGSRLLGQSFLNRLSSYKIIGNTLSFTYNKDVIITNNDIYTLIQSGKKTEVINKLKSLYEQGRLDYNTSLIYGALLFEEKNYFESAKVYRNLYSIDSGYVEYATIESSILFLRASVLSANVDFIFSALRLGKTIEKKYFSKEDKSELLLSMSLAYLSIGLTDNSVNYSLKSIELYDKPNYVDENYLINHKYNNPNLGHRYMILGECYDSKEDFSKGAYYKKIAQNCGYEE